MTIKEIFDKQQVNLSNEQEGDLLKFEKLLIEYNKMFNLTSITNSQDIYVKHFLDSLMGKDYFQGKIVEIGSGGGFPSVPLKLYNKELDFTLIESTNKKCNFLNKVKQEFNLQQFNVLCDRCEELALKSEYREKFDVVTARAVARLNTLLEYCVPFIKIGGKFVAYKTQDDIELSESENAQKVLGVMLSKKIQYILTDNSQRVIYIFTKISPTPTKYPRGRGKERSKPL